MGFSDVGCFGSEIRTSNIDLIAKGGVVFSQMYNCARCCPSRASLLTGLYPHQAGVGHMVSNIGLPGYEGYLNDKCLTIAEALKLGGYRTHLAGKWHVGGYYPISERGRWRIGAAGHPTPIGRGFDSHFGTLGGAGSFFNPHGLVRNDKLVKIEQDDFYYTDEIAAYAETVIDEEARAENPFFLYVAYTAPHWPLHALPEDIERYRGRYLKGWDYVRTSRHETLKGLDIVDSKWEISPRDAQSVPWEEISNKEWEDARMAVYAAQIDRMDQGIGRILRRLQMNNIEEDTIVMFLSDNGGCAEFLREDGHFEYIDSLTRDGRRVHGGNHSNLTPGTADTFMSYGLPWANASNAPFRLFKHWVHEGGISTPFIVRGPGVQSGGVIVREPAHVVDILATCIDLAGVSYPTEYEGRSLTPLEGDSLRPALAGRGWSRSAPLCWEHEGNRAVRFENWKLVSQYPGRWELYDMNSDRTELHDLSEKNGNLVEKLKDVYEDWAERCGVIPWDDIRKMKGDEFLGR